MSAAQRKRGRRRTPCPRCDLTTCEHCRCEGCAECDHGWLECDRARYPKRFVIAGCGRPHEVFAAVRAPRRATSRVVTRTLVPRRTMCTSCIKKQEKKRKPRKRGQAAAPMALVAKDRRGGKAGHAELTSLSGLFARAAALHHLHPNEALRQAASDDLPGFGSAMSSLSGLVASLGPDFAPLARSLPPRACPRAGAHRSPRFAQTITPSHAPGPVSARSVPHKGRPRILGGLRGLRVAHRVVHGPRRPGYVCCG